MSNNNNYNITEEKTQYKLIQDEFSGKCSPTCRLSENHLNPDKKRLKYYHKPRIRQEMFVK